MECLITIILGAVISIILFWKARSNANYWNKCKIPHLKSLPILGNMYDVVLLKKTFGENVYDMYTKLNGFKYGGYMQFTKPVLIVRDPELVSQVMIKEFKHFNDRGLPMCEEIEPLSANLINLAGDRWRQVRSKLISAFSSGKLKIMFNQIVKCSDEATEFLKDKREAIEVKQYMQKFNLNVIGLVAFGLKVDALNSRNARNDEFIKQSIKFFSPSRKLLLNFLIRMSCPRLGKVLKLQTMDPEVTHFFKELVRDTIQYREKTNTKRNDFIQLLLDLKKQETTELVNSLNSTTSKDYLSYVNKRDVSEKQLLKPSNEHAFNVNQSQTPVFTDMCITAQSFFFISGGSETTAIVLNFALYELAVNLNVQDRVRKEVDIVLSSKKFDYQVVKEMIYLEQVINEVMRLHPPAGVLSRVCTKDLILPGTDVLVEKGVIINIPVLGLHKNPEYFPNPETFNPDRFNDMKAIPKGVFLPFGDGPRKCIAMRLALLEMKIYLAKLVSKYSFTLSNKTQLPLKLATDAILPNIVGGIWVNFTERKQ